MRRGGRNGGKKGQVTTCRAFSPESPAGVVKPCCGQGWDRHRNEQKSDLPHML